MSGLERVDPMANRESRMQVPPPQNEPVHNYAPGDERRQRLEKGLKRMASEKMEIPLFIGGKEIRTGKTKQVVMPHDHGHVLAEFHLAGPDEMRMAAQAALKAKKDWEALSPGDRSAVFLKAADLLSGPYRDRMNAATMLGQSKNVYQAEIDAACEFIDFLRFNALYYQQILEMQPDRQAPGIWNSLDYRPLEGFVLAITPFNFTAIAGNLAAAPALVGNTIVWKPSDTQMLSAYYTMCLFQEAGVPPGVINMLGADGPQFGETMLKMPEMSGVHFTGSTATFQKIYQTVGNNISQYRSYPRIVGETGGKDFVFAHPSADMEALGTALVRGAFEYQGQKCSAASRAYVPRSMWPQLKERIVADVKSFKMGSTTDFSNFVNAVIDERSFKKITGYLDFAREASNAEFLVGGKGDSSKGYFVEPTIIETSDPQFKTMQEEIFGPVLTVYAYEDSRLSETLDVCDQTSPYGLTGAIFSQDRQAVDHMTGRLRHAAGNFYINDKPTGAVVGQQPFGGGRYSGTNDKAGSLFNLLRWISPRTIKETFDPPKNYRYPFLG